MADPVVNHFDTTIFLNSVINATDMFSAFDPDGDLITTLRFQDFNSDNSSGFYRLNGVDQANGGTFDITLADLANLEYVGGSRIANERFRVIAFTANGEVSDFTTFGTAYTVRANTTQPVVNETSFAVLANENEAIDRFITATDPDGYPITQYFIKDNTVDNGYLSLNGTRLAQDNFTLIQTADMPGLRYHTTGLASTEQLYVFAYDGAQWSKRGVIGVDTLLNANRPVAQFANTNVISREIIPMAPLSVLTDDDGNSIKWYEFWNTSPHANHGELLLNGNVLPRRTWIRVQANQLGNLEYEAPDRNLAQQQIRFRGSDGKFLSGEATITIRTTFVDPPPPIVRPVLASDDFSYGDQLEIYQVDSMFRKDDDGNPYTMYELYDSNVDVESGRFRVNTNNLPGGVIHQFSAGAIATRVDFQAGEYNNRHRDDLYARAFNGDEWGRWERLTTRSEPELSRTQMSGNNWPNYFQIPVDGLGRYELTFSFMQLFPDYETGEAEDGNPLEGRQFERFTEGQRIATREAFLAIEAVTNLRFLEVPDTSTNVFGGRGGIFRFGEYGIPFPDSMAQAFAFLPSTAPQAADIWVNRLLISDVSLQYGGPGFNTMMHEMMHALGYLHVFEGSSIVPASLNNDRFSVLSGPGGGRPDGLQPTTPQIYDIESLQAIYGENTRANAGDTLYDLSGYWADRPDPTGDGIPDFAEAIWDPSGNDTLSAEGSISASIIDLSPGGFSSINGFNQNVSIAYRAEIENAIGSDHADQLFGNHLANSLTGGDGKDFLDGQGGDDLLFGGSGSDTYTLGVGDGFDIINEQAGTGNDTLQLTEFPEINLLEEDVEFSLEGRDLIVDLNLNNGQNESSVRIVNQIWGRYQVETLVLDGTRIDLKDLTSQIKANPSDSKFMLDTGSTTYGRLVVPV